MLSGWAGKYRLEKTHIMLLHYWTERLALRKGLSYKGYLGGGWMGNHRSDLVTDLTTAIPCERHTADSASANHHTAKRPINRRETPRPAPGSTTSAPEKLAAKNTAKTRRDTHTFNHTHAHICTFPMHQSPSQTLLKSLQTHFWVV